MDSNQPPFNNPINGIRSPAFPPPHLKQKISPTNPLTNYIEYLNANRPTVNSSTPSSSFGPGQPYFQPSPLIPDLPGDKSVPDRKNPALILTILKYIVLSIIIIILVGITGYLFTNLNFRN